MALENLTSKIPEPLQRQIGPFPLWVWVGGVGGGLLFYMYLNRSGEGGTDSGNEEPQDEDFDFDTFDTIGGFGGGSDDTSLGGTPPPPSGGGGVNIDPLNLRCPKGFKKGKNKTGKWTCKKVKKPAIKKGQTLRWNWKLEKWVIERTKSFTLEEPHVDMLAAPNGSVPTISEQQVSAIGIAAPDRTPRVAMEPLVKTEMGNTDPVPAVRVPPAPMNRTPGRPFHGPNLG